MCCRFYIDKETPEMKEILRQMHRSPLMERFPATDATGEIRPTDIAPVIAPDRKGQPAIFPMQWGYHARSILINARVETVAEKPTFREDWLRHRCIIPATSYFEWEHQTGPDGRISTGAKYAIHPANGTPTWLCGLYHIEAGLPYFVVLTREPADSIRFIHDRMPMLLPEDRLAAWISPKTKPEALLPYAVTDVEYEIF